MKPVVQMLIEAGIIDRDTVLALEKWGNLDPGAADLVGTKRPTTKRDKAAFVERISELLDAALEEPPKETRLEVHGSEPFMVAHAPSNFLAVWDEMGRLICAPGTQVTTEDWLMIKHQQYLVDTVTKLYQGETVVALQLDVSRAQIVEV